MSTALATPSGDAPSRAELARTEGATSALWPGAGQELLLRAATVQGPGALAAWEDWKDDHDLIETELDHGSFRLLALVYKNLLACGAEEPLMPRLKGIYRYWWCSNQRLFYRAAGVVHGLEQAGIPVLALKGTAASVAFYRDTGVRPMADIDLMVPHAQAAAAVAQLGRHGWKSARRRVADLIRYQHSVRMVHETGEALDLHWHVLAECVQPDADQGFWARAIPIQILDAHARALAPTDALLHAIVHGMRWNAEPTIRWVADAMAILHGANGGIDWSTLGREARARRMVLRLRMGLDYLRRRMDAPIPEEAVRRLQATPVSGIERLEYRVLTLGSDGGRRLRPGHILLVLVQYLRFVSGKPLVQKLLETPAYVSYRLRGRRGPVFDAARAVLRGIRTLFAQRSPTGAP